MNVLMKYARSVCAGIKSVLVTGLIITRNVWPASAWLASLALHASCAEVSQTSHQSQPPKARRSDMYVIPTWVPAALSHPQLLMN